MKKQFEAIFLDNDGILVDTEKYYAEACDEISRDLFGIPISLETYQEYGYTKGIGVQEFLVENGVPREKIPEFRQIRDKRYMEKLSQEITPLPGVVDFLERIKSPSFAKASSFVEPTEDKSDGRREVVIACVTATHINNFLQIHNQTGLLPYFKFWVVNEDVKKTKPSPEGYLLAAKKAGVNPANCLVIEDSPRGIKAGKEAGMTVYAIPTEQTKKLDLSLADKKFAGFSELMDFLKK